MDNSLALQVIGLVKRFSGGVPVVDDVSLEVRPGEIVSLLGPSGCGKTTTMRIIAGLERPDVGDVMVHGKMVTGVPAHRRNIGLVFQDLAIFPHKTVRENVAFGLRMKGIKGVEARLKVDEVMELVELPASTFASRMPSELSGGQRQRVAVARTIVAEPSVILFDEPMAALDRRLKDRMAVELRRIQKQLGIAAVYVTHDQETASMMSDRIAIMSSGKIRQIAAPEEIYRRPADRFVADFIGDMNFIRAAVTGFADGTTILDVEGNQVTVAGGNRPTMTSVTLAIRPEHIVMRPGRTSHALAQAQLKGLHFINGTFVHLLALASGLEVTVRAAASEGALGDVFWLYADTGDIRLLET